MLQKSPCNRFRPFAWRAAVIGPVALAAGAALGQGPGTVQSFTNPSGTLKTFSTAGAIDPDGVHLPGIYVKRIFQGVDYQKRIERRMVRAGAA